MLGGLEEIPEVSNSNKMTQRVKVLATKADSPPNPYDGRREPIPTGYPLTSTCVLYLHMCSKHTYDNTH